MKEDLVRRSIEKNRLQLTLGEKEGHYGIVIAFSIPLLILFFFYIKGLIAGNWTIHPDFYYVVVISTALAVVAYVIQFRRLGFTNVSSNLTKHQILNLIEDIAEKNKWHLDISTENAIIYKSRPGFWSGSWGEQITILIDKNRLMINSICDPDRPSSVFSNGRNTKNIELLKKRFHQPASSSVHMAMPG